MEKYRAIPEGYMTVGKPRKEWALLCGHCSIMTERACCLRPL